MDDDGTTVTVEVTPPVEPEVVEPEPVVVVVEEPSGNDAETSQLFQLTERLASLELRLEEAIASAYRAEATAEIASEIAVTATEQADDAEEIAEDAVAVAAEESEPEPEPEDEEPNRDHFWHRKMGSR